MSVESPTQAIAIDLGKPLSAVEASQFIHCTISYLYKLTHRRLIPHYKPNGKRLYFRRQELESWLLRNQVKTAECIDRQAANHVVNGRGA